MTLKQYFIPNAIENLDLSPRQSPGIGRSNLAPISNSGDGLIAPIAGAFASVLNQIFSRVGYIFLAGCIPFFSDVLLATSVEPSNLPATFHEFAIQSTLHEIESISNYITHIHCQQAKETELSELYNARGIRYFCAGLLQEAIDDFNQVLNIIGHKEVPEMSSMGLAIWGRMLCHAYQNCEEEAIQDLNLFRSYFLSECSPCLNSQENEPNWPLYSDCNYQGNRMLYKRLSKFLYSHATIDNLRFSDNLQLIAQFADPNERLSSSECKFRVRETAKIMRLLSAKIKNTYLVGLVNLAISDIEDFMCNCCDRNHWTECLSPIIDAYKYMKGCMDKGVAIAPRIIWPGR